MDVKTKLRNELKKAVAAVEQYDVDHKQLWRNVSTFSNNFENPFRDDARTAHELMSKLAANLNNAAQAAYMADVRPSTIARICNGFINRFNLGVWTS